MLECLHHQSFKNFEHIIVNDGSTDDTVLELQRFQNKHKEYPLKVISSLKSGRGHSLNQAIALSTTNWVAIIDCDDLWDINKLHLQWEVVCENEFDVIATRSVLFSDSNDITLRSSLTKTEKLTHVSLKDILRSNPLLHSSVLIRRELCVYDIHRKSQFDYELWLRLAHDGYKIAILNEYLTYHRIHENQSFEGKMSKAYLWRSFKLKFDYSLNVFHLKSIIYNPLKFIFDLLLPRDTRLFIKKSLGIGITKQ